MIPLFVFFVHVVAVTAVFTKRWQEDGLTEGFLSVFFMAVIFFVGWSMSSFTMKLFMSQDGVAPWFNRDAAALLLLTAAETVFYYFYFRDKDHTGGGNAGRRSEVV
jgi:hypothetical protein